MFILLHYKDDRELYLDKKYIQSLAVMSDGCTEIGTGWETFYIVKESIEEVLKAI